jgi:hypothetical protein
MDEIVNRGRSLARLCVAMLVVCCVSNDAEAGRFRSRGWNGEEATPQLQVTPTQFVDHRNRKVDGSAGYNADLVTDLPQGAGEKLHLTLVTADPPTQRDIEVAEWFRSDPRLVHFRSQSHWNWYTTSSPHYRERLYPTYGDAVPLVMFQTPTGEILMNARSGPDGRLPRSSGELADMLNVAAQARFAPPDFAHVQGAQQPAIIREGDCPDGSCTPPNLGPAQPVPQVVPVPPLERGLQMLVVFLVIAGVIGGGLLFVASIVGAGVLLFLRRQPADDSILPARPA